MKTLHVPFHFFPEHVGGTEVYALSLVQQLKALGEEAEIAAPGSRSEGYFHQGVNVFRFAVGDATDVADLYGEGDELALREFGKILHASRPDLIHLHGTTRAISLRLVRQARATGIPVVFTVHIPGIVCSRGTLLENGKQVCDGELRVRRCTTCVLQKHMPRPLASIVSGISAVAGKTLHGTKKQAAWVTALRMTELQQLHQNTLARFLSEVDSIVVVSDWLREVMIRNGVAAEEITVCRHGSTQSRGTWRGPKTGTGDTKRIAFFGRLEENKGPHILVEALAQKPWLPLELDIYGIVQDAGNYVARLRASARRDRRIQFKEPVPNDRVIETLASYDAAAIPSIWLETGPLTVYDAFAAGVPVIGSRRGGIAELVTHEVDGLLVEAGNAAAWAGTFDRIIREGGLLEKLAQGVRPPRTMQTVAEEMLDLYRAVARRAKPEVYGEKLSVL